jgi:hypothetical protein
MEIRMKNSRKDLVLTSVWMPTAAYAQFLEIANADGTTGAALLRGFVLQTVRKIAKQSAQH